MTSDELHRRSQKLWEDADAAWSRGEKRAALDVYRKAARTERDAMTAAQQAESRAEWAAILAVSAAALYLRGGDLMGLDDLLPGLPVGLSSRQQTQLASIVQAARAMRQALDPTDKSVSEGLAVLTSQEREIVSLVARAQED